MAAAQAAAVADIQLAAQAAVSKVEITVDLVEQMGVTLCLQDGQHHLQVMVERMEFVELEVQVQAAVVT
jgi:hypothetical protein